MLNSRNITQDQRIAYIIVKAIILYLNDNASICDSIRSPSYDPVPDIDVHSLMLASSIHSSRRFLPCALFSVHFSFSLFFLLFKTASSLMWSKFQRSRRWACSSRRAFRKCSRMAWARRANLSEEAAYYCQARTPGPPPELRQKWHFPRNSLLISKFSSTREIWKGIYKHSFQFILTVERKLKT